MRLAFNNSSLIMIGTNIAIMPKKGCFLPLVTHYNLPSLSIRNKHKWGLVIATGL